MSGTKFYYATFDISGNWSWEDIEPSSSTEERVWSVLHSYFNSEQPVVETNTGDWYFGKVEPDESDYPPEGRFYGKFGKVYSDEPMVYDEEEGDFVEADEPNKEADYSLFMLDVERRLIAFSSTYRVRNKNFVRYFRKGFNRRTTSDMEISFSPVENTMELDEVLGQYPVYELEAELHPSNPSPQPAWEDLDTAMQNMLVDKLGIDAERFEEEGINVEEDFIQQVSTMAMSDYGESWYVQYVDENEELQVVTSGTDPVTKQFEEDVDSTVKLRQRTEDVIDRVASFLD